MKSMRIFIGHFVNPEKAHELNISVAASNFSDNLVNSGIFDKAYSILPAFVKRVNAPQTLSSTKFSIIYSRFRELPKPLNRIAPIFEQVILLNKIPRYSSVWLYNITPLNRLFIKMVRILKPSVKIFPIILDYTPTSSSAAKELRIINRAAGRISLSNYRNILKINYRCLPGIVPDHTEYPEIATTPPVFILSGVLLEQISSLSKVVETFKMLPEATLYITGDISTRPEMIDKIQEVPNIHLLGNISKHDFINLLDKVTFVLSSRDTSYPENQCNFPSKIIEGIMHNRIIVSTISYPQLSDIKYFKIGCNVASMTKDITKIVSMPQTTLLEYANQSIRAKDLFSSNIWKEQIVEIERPYDLVYLTNTPSFYKLNLCREIARRGVKLLVVFNGIGSEAVNASLTPELEFDWYFLFEGDYWQRPKVKVLKRLHRLLSSINIRNVVFSGWMSIEYNIYSFMSPRRRNIMICESSKFEVTTIGFKGWVKRQILKRMHTALPSGEPHRELLEILGLKGPQYVTGSVGIFNMDHKRSNFSIENRLERIRSNGFRFLYVGRLTSVKNLPLLIECFNRNKLPLTIAGDGELKHELQQIASSNIKFIGFIPNEELYKIYNEHDVFILPSLSESWGLVVEEALFRGLPTIVSDMVGSGPDMVEATGAGVIFDHKSSDSLQKAIDRITDEYPLFLKAVEGIDFEKRKRQQIEAYLKAIE